MNRRDFISKSPLLGIIPFIEWDKLVKTKKYRGYISGIKVYNRYDTYFNNITLLYHFNGKDNSNFV